MAEADAVDDGGRWVKWMVCDGVALCDVSPPPALCVITLDFRAMERLRDCLVYQIKALDLRVWIRYPSELPNRALTFIISNKKNRKVTPEISISSLPSNKLPIA